MDIFHLNYHLIPPSNLHPYPHRTPRSPLQDNQLHMSMKKILKAASNRKVALIEEESSSKLVAPPSPIVKNQNLEFKHIRRVKNGKVHGDARSSDQDALVHFDPLQTRQ